MNTDETKTATRNIRLNKHNVAVYRVASKDASKDASRYTLAGIQITEKGTCATDGYMLAVVGLPGQSIDDPSVQTVPIAPCVIASESCADIEKKNTSKNPSINLNGIFSAEKGIAEAKPVDGQFPDWQQIMPKETSAGMSIYLNPELLKKLGDLLERVSRVDSNKSPMVRVTFDAIDPSNSCVRFDTKTPEGQPVTALLMPMRGTYKNSEHSIPLHKW